MTRAHGDPSRYSNGPDIDDQPGKGCRCTKCTKAASRARELHRVAVLTGEAKPTVPAGPVRDHLLALCATGMSPLSISRQAGVSHSQISRLLHKDSRTGKPPKRLRAHTAEALLAVQAWDSALMFPVIGSRRRLQGLALLGWPNSVFVKRLGIARQQVWRIMHHDSKKLLHATVATQITNMCRRLCTTTPAWSGIDPRRIEITRRRAVEAGWVPLMAWDDIDNPDAVPDLGEETPREQATLEAGRELVERYGYTWKAAAQRLGISASYLRHLNYDARRLAETSTEPAPAPS